MEIKKYSLITVAEHWVFAILIIGLILTGVPTFYNVFMHKIGIYGTQIPYIQNSQYYHKIFGIPLVFLALFHILAHFTNRELITQNPYKDIKNFLHTFLFIIGFAKKEERGGGEKFKSYQRITYLLYVYTLGLTIITGILLLYPSYFKLSEGLERAVFSTHIISMFFVILIFIYHLLINIRKWQIVPYRTMFGDGKVPISYIRKNNKMWYSELIATDVKEIKIEPKNEESAIALKIHEMIGVLPNENELEESADLVKGLKKEDYERVKELVE